MSSQRGYVLLILLLFVALLSIGALKVVQEFKFQYQRDREEELIHRGVQYSRAMRRYFKKFGRYPTRIEDLENTNKMRFLRKRYTDPMNRDPSTGKERDFKLLHLTDVQMSFNSGANGAVAVQGVASQQLAAQGANGISTAPAGAAAGSAVPQEPQPAAPGDNSQADQEATAAPAPQPLSQQPGANGEPQLFGGGAIVGVASASKDKTIREFNKKNHYNQWQFIYDPTTDRGGLLMTPNQPPLQGATQNQQQNGQPGMPGQTGTGFSQSGNEQAQQPSQDQR